MTVSVLSRDHRIRALKRRFLEEPSPELAYEIVTLELRSEGAQELTWAEVLQHPDPELAELAERLRRAIRSAVKQYLADTPWSEGTAFHGIPVSRLAAISQAHYRYLDGVGPATAKLLAQLFERLGLDWDEGSTQEAETDWECQSLGALPVRFHGEFFDLLECYRARALLFERLVEPGPAYEALSKVKRIGAKIADFDPWPDLEGEEWARRCEQLPKLIQQDLIHLLEQAEE